MTIRLVTIDECCLNTRICWQVVTSQTATRPSADPVTSRVPSIDVATAVTSRAWPTNTYRRVGWRADVRDTFVMKPTPSTHTHKKKNLLGSAGKVDLKGGCQGTGRADQGNTVSIGVHPAHVGRLLGCVHGHAVEGGGKGDRSDHRVTGQVKDPQGAVLRDREEPPGAHATAGGVQV